MYFLYLVTDNKIHPRKLYSIHGRHNCCKRFAHIGRVQVSGDIQITCAIRATALLEAYRDFKVYCSQCYQLSECRSATNFGIHLATKANFSRHVAKRAPRGHLHLTSAFAFPYHQISYCCKVN